MALPGPVKKLAKQFKDVRSELKKVHWPNRRELYLYSSLVLLTVIVIGIFFWVLDSGFTAGLRLILQQ
jgi:preprotein translocase subunit SecE